MFSEKPSLWYSLTILWIVNLIPLYGVVFLGWKLFPIIFFYWLENIPIGFYNVLKMKKEGGKTGPIGFFIIQFGVFTTIHGFFIFGFFGPSTVSWIYVIFFLVSLFVSHGFSFFRNFIGSKEYLNTTSESQMFKPYGRVFITHLVIIFGAMLLNTYGQPIYPLFILIGLKVLIDTLAHILEHLNKSVVPQETM